MFGKQTHSHTSTLFEALFMSSTPFLNRKLFAGLLIFYTLEFRDRVCVFVRACVSHHRPHNKSPNYQQYLYVLFTKCVRTLSSCARMRLELKKLITHILAFAKSSQSRTLSRARSSRFSCVHSTLPTHKRAHTQCRLTSFLHDMYVDSAEIAPDSPIVNNVVCVATRDSVRVSGWRFVHVLYLLHKPRVRANISYPFSPAQHLWVAFFVFALRDKL